MATASIATTPYRPPLATGTPTTTNPTTIDYNYGTSTDQPGNTNIYLYYFIVPYLDAHVLSPPSWRYAYILWIFLPVVLFLWSFFYQLNRRLLRSNHLFHHPLRPLYRLLLPRLIPPTTTSISTTRSSQIPRWYASTINRGQLVSLLSFTIVLVALSLVGDDYISPTTCTWGGRCPVQVFNQGPPRSTYLPSRRLRRSTLSSPPPTLPSHPHRPFLRRSTSLHVLQPRASALSLNPNGWAPFTDPLLSAPNTNVPRTLWTLSSRFGLIAYALIPFVVSIGLKSWPFNVLAIPYLTHYGFDRTSMIHRWTGRLIWVWSTIHTITFSVQLARDLNPYDNMILTDVWKYYRFNWGVAAYVALTITVCFSFNPLRNRYYEFFYCSHVVLCIVFLVGCIIHYEPLWAWAVIGLTLWGAERTVRLMGWLWFNGFFDSPIRFWSNQPRPQTIEGSPVHPETAPNRSPRSSLAVGFPATNHLCPPPSSSTLILNHPSSSPYPTHTLHDHDTPVALPLKHTIGSAEIPAGFALVQVLPGHTLRLTLKMVKSARWDIGQYLLLCVPSVSWWQTHPYTICASSALSDFDQSSQTNPGKELVLLLRARQGFSKKFYEYIMHVKAEDSQNGGLKQVPAGTLVRCQISRPLGSSGRISWDSLDSLLIVCGGSGISFGISALEETCFKMWSRSRSDPGRTSNTTVSRVCLVWIFREYAHLSWVAPSLKRCLGMIPRQDLQINLFVSNSLRHKKPSQAQGPSCEVAHVPKVDVDDSQTLLVPPHPPFLRSAPESDCSGSSSARNSFAGSITVTESDHSHALEADVPIEFTDFEGENQNGTDAEMMVSANVKLEGKRRRKNTLLRAQGLHGWKPKGILGHGREIDSSEAEKQESDPIELKNENAKEFEGPFEVTNHETPWKDELMRELGLDLTKSERVALEELSESIKSGRPKLKKILKREIENSTGRTLVACCGPDSLNSYMRTLVSQQDLGSQGTRKDIDIYTEDFSY